MKDDTLWFTVVPQDDGEFTHHIELGNFPYNFIYPSVPDPFLRANEEIGHISEVVENLKDNIVNFTCVILHIQDGGAYPLGLDKPPDFIGLCITTLL